VEEILKQILGELNSLKQGQDRLEAGQKGLEKGQREIKSELKYIWDDIKKIDARLTKQLNFRSSILETKP